jgi:hypothetical protein
MFKHLQAYCSLAIAAECHPLVLLLRQMCAATLNSAKSALVLDISRGGSVASDVLP